MFVQLGRRPTGVRRQLNDSWLLVDYTSHHRQGNISWLRDSLTYWVITQSWYITLSMSITFTMWIVAHHPYCVWSCNTLSCPLSPVPSQVSCNWIVITALLLPRVYCSHLGGLSACSYGATLILPRVYCSHLGGLSTCSYGATLILPRVYCSHLRGLSTCSYGATLILPRVYCSHLGGLSTCSYGATLILPRVYCSHLGGLSTCSYGATLVTIIQSHMASPWAPVHLSCSTLHALCYPVFHPVFHPLFFCIYVTYVIINYVV
jgi:hypothetical protein